MQERPRNSLVVQEAAATILVRLAASCRCGGALAPPARAWPRLASPLLPALRHPLLPRGVSPWLLQGPYALGQGSSEGEAGTAERRWGERHSTWPWRICQASLYSPL